ncbi:GNAT family N-acetyltransferase [Flavobacterium sp. LS1P28]|uniref:GNAT family N-acetyltransferase n=1 Tax=Flavobacterium bomense TaxID=2497483 RepID=A0A3S0MCG2_9FLAO|nr:MULTISPECIES: GNAT family N-acetyltransferase [Flavobacterium]RTY82525.1 GNAT family N-acetyltransferase [Flavobacterium sp. LS1P28]RTY90689.1 GNAT family N-acetyltransferase [Flavobacterium sp. RSP46]RTZ03701.1 GNAT family N-acetyltransferase [Flavobacterium bomense]
MISISEATTKDLKTIQEIAYKTWPQTYGAILSKEQIDYMLELFYSEHALLENLIQKGHRFLLVHQDEFCLGFASYSHNYLAQNLTRLHKIYLLPEAQGKGAGKLLIDTIENLARENNSVAVSLNVNKFNNALSFYKKIGFEIVSEEDIELKHGYKMEDYRMEKKL